MSYRIVWKVKGSAPNFSLLKRKIGKRGAVGFKTHLKEVYGNAVKVRILKSKRRAYI